jgi:hypothetical protein
MGGLVPLPQLAGATEGCSYEFSPAVTYGAGGGRLYAAYLYIRADPSCATGLSGVAFSVSADQGATWSTPKSIFAEASTCTGFSPDRESFFADGEGYNDVRLAAAPDEPWVYVAAQRFSYHDLVNHLGSSGDQGLTWTDRQVAHIFSDGPEYYRGFALAAAQNGNVLVAFGYQAGDAGYDATYRLYVRRASDHGASVDPNIVIAGQSDSSLLSSPDIKIGPSGTAHLVYAKGGESILYKYSYPPYSTWSSTSIRLDNNVPRANGPAPARRGRLRTGERPARDLGRVSGRSSGFLGQDRLYAQGGAAWLRLVRPPEGRPVEEWHLHERPRRRGAQGVLGLRGKDQPGVAQ